MTLLTDEDIRGFPNSATPPLIESVQCHRCFFTDAGVPPFWPPENRFVLRDCHLTRCRAVGGHYHGVVFDSCDVTSLTGLGSHPHIFWACAFRHVTLRGVMPTMLFKPGYALDQPSPDYDLANADFYTRGEWALDISEARFGTTIAFDGIPHELVVRDPDSQFVLPRSTAALFPPSVEGRTLWHNIASDVLRGNTTGTVVALGKRSKRYAADLKLALSLRAAALLQ